MRGTRTARRASVVASAIYLIWASLAMTDGRWLPLAVFTGLWLVAALRASVVAIGGLAAAVYVGEPWLIVAFGLLLVLRSYKFVLPLRALRRRASPAAFVAALDAVDARHARVLAAAAGEYPISSVAMAVAAAAEAPGPWHDVLVDTTPEDWDGELLRDSSGRAWTAVAAEAVILAERLIAMAEALTTIQAYAAAALVLPETALGEALRHRTDPMEIAAQVTGLAQHDLVEMGMAFFVKESAGADAFRRMEIRATIDAGRMFPGVLLFNLSSGRLWLLRATKYVLPWLPDALSPLPTTLRLTDGHTFSSTEPALPPPTTTALAASGPPPVAPPPAPEPLPDAAPAPAFQTAVAAHPEPTGWRAWWQLSVRSSSGLDTALLRVLRPLTTAAAAALALWSDGPWWARALLAAGPILLRPMRRWWLDLVLAAGAAAAGLLPLAGALLVRAAVTGFVLARRGTDAGIAVPRRALVASWVGNGQDWIQPPDAAWDIYLRRLTTDDYLLDRGVEYAASVWAMGDGLAFGRALIAVFRIEVLGRQPVPGLSPRLTNPFILLLVIESVTDRGIRMLGAASAGVVAWFTMAARDWVVGPVHVSSAWAVAASAMLVGSLAARRVPAYKTAGVIAAAGLFWLGVEALPTVAVVVVWGVTGRTIRLWMDRRSTNVPPRLAWVGRRVLGLRYHARHQAAARLAAQGRPGIAADLLGSIAAATRERRPASATAALAHRALVELDRGYLQRAVEHTEALREIGGRTRSRTALALASYAEGVVGFSVGDYETAVSGLERAEPVLRRHPEGGACAALLAQAYAVLGHWERAADAAGRSARGMRKPGQYQSIMSANLATGWALLRQGQPARAAAFIDNVEMFFRDDPFEDRNRTTDERNRNLRRRLDGEAKLLFGRARLAEGDLDGASTALGEALQLLRRAGAADLEGMARIYEGECLRLRGEWVPARERVRVGADLLEHRRGQLAAGPNRATAVAAGSDHEDTALGVLADAQRNGDATSGAVAASLIESLRRNALAATLRDDQRLLADRLPPEARDTLRHIARLELGADANGRSAEELTAELTTLRADLESAVSHGFANAYLPEAVDYQRLTAPVRRAHVLQFEMIETAPDRWRGYRVWVPPEGSPWVDEIIVTDAAALEILHAIRHDGTTTDPEPNAEALLAQFEDVASSWAALAEAVLPYGLVTELRARSADHPIRLIVVPGEHLAYLPWSALLLDPGDENAVLLHKAVIQVVPSLDLLRRPAPSAPGGQVLAYLDADAVSSINDGGRRHADSWRSLNAELPIVQVHSREQFEQYLSDPRIGGIYLIAHGNGTGLAQSISFSTGGDLSAAAALQYRWPRSLVFASCFVAKVEQRAGREPLGLVVACMLGGCQTVIGGVILVERAATGEIAAAATIAIAAGVNPAVALRNAQRRFLDRAGGALAFTNEWAGLICISTEWAEGV